MINSSKVFFDARHINKGGIGIYIKGVLDRLISNDINLCLITTNEDEIKGYIKNENVCFLKAPKLFTIKEQIWFLFNYFTFLNKIYISPYLTFPLFVKTKLIYVIHDLIWLKKPDYATGKLGYYYFKFFLRHGITRSKHIITVSNSTKKDMQKYFKICASKIKVIYNGIKMEDFSDVRPINTDYKYFIYVGNWKKWKNVPILLDAFTRFLVKTNAQNVKLVLCGDYNANMSDDINSIVSKNGDLVKKVIITGKVERNELLSYIKGATALIQPSEVEGFGIPVIEALALNVPVFCSDIEVFREIADGYVKYFVPGDVQNLTDELIQFYRNNFEQNNCAKISPNLLFEKFNWQKTTDYIFEICHIY